MLKNTLSDFRKKAISKVAATKVATLVFLSRLLILQNHFYTIWPYVSHITVSLPKEFPMPSFVEIQGITALNNVALAIPSAVKLTAKLMERNGMKNTSISSCNMTASLLFETINATPPKAVQGLNNLSETAKASKVGNLLSQKNLVCLSITPDHHFVVFPISETSVCLLQAFQDVYNFRQWYDNSNQGKMDKTAFVNNLTKLVSGNQASRVLAARELFSYQDAVVIAEIAKYFMAPGHCGIQAIAYNTL